MNLAWATCGHTTAIVLTKCQYLTLMHFHGFPSIFSDKETVEQVDSTLMLN